MSLSPQRRRHRRIAPTTVDADQVLLWKETLTALKQKLRDLEAEKAHYNQWVVHHGGAGQARARDGEVADLRRQLAERDATISVLLERLAGCQQEQCDGPLQEAAHGMEDRNRGYLVLLPRASPDDQGRIQRDCGALPGAVNLDEVQPAYVVPCPLHVVRSRDDAASWSTMVQRFCKADTLRELILVPGEGFDVPLAHQKFAGDLRGLATSPSRPAHTSASMHPDATDATAGAPAPQATTRDFEAEQDGPHGSVEEPVGSMSTGTDRAAPHDGHLGEEAAPDERPARAACALASPVDAAAVATATLAARDDAATGAARMLACPVGPAAEAKQATPAPLLEQDQQAITGNSVGNETDKEPKADSSLATVGHLVLAPRQRLAGAVVECVWERAKVCDVVAPRRRIHVQFHDGDLGQDLTEEHVLSLSSTPEFRMQTLVVGEMVLCPLATEGPESSVFFPAHISGTVQARSKTLVVVSVCIDGGSKEMVVSTDRLTPLEQLNAETSVLSTGNEVLARYRNRAGGKYLRGCIQEAHRTPPTEAIYDVQYDDGELESAVEPRNIRRLPALSFASARHLQVGDEAIVAFRGKASRLYLATIEAVHGSGDDVVYDVLYADGDREASVPFSKVVALDHARDPSSTAPNSGDEVQAGTTPTAVADLQPKDMVMAAARGRERWYKGTIKRVRKGRMTYDVKYEDGEIEHGVSDSNVCLLSPAVSGSVDYAAGHKVAVTVKNSAFTVGQVKEVLSVDDSLYTIAWQSLPDMMIHDAAVSHLRRVPEASLEGSCFSVQVPNELVQESLQRRPHHLRRIRAMERNLRVNDAVAAWWKTGYCLGKVHGIDDVENDGSVSEAMQSAWCHLESCEDGAALRGVSMSHLKPL